MKRIMFVSLALSQTAAGSLNADPVSFQQSVLPLLSDRCFPCHGPDARHRKGELRLDQREAAVMANAIVPGDPAGSGLVQRIHDADAATRMPPAATNKPLSAAEKALLVEWVKEGARYERLWSLTPPARPALPPGAAAIDELVERRRRSLGMAASPPADRRTLARRLHFDLIGLPPTPETVDAFINDSTPNAVETLVDQLLRSPHFGERMAMGWLDVARFADTIGYHSDNPRNIWPYRDYVIRSFNANKPFDRFTREQLAGDLLPDANQESRVGSAFNRLVLSTEEGGAQAKDYEARMLADRVRAVGAVWLGQTTGCAQCHDHKYDPLTQMDFYSLGAFFADIKEAAVGRREVGMPIVPAEHAIKLDELQRAARDASGPAREIAEKRLREFLEQQPTCLVSDAAPTPRVVRLLPRGNWMDESGPLALPAFPAYLRGAYVDPPTGRRLTRLDLADWLVAPDHPLTARVVMNRLWKQFFGIGLSKVLDDLGAQGEPPRHAELLDWLAREFIESGWNVKQMVRLMVTSQTYRQASRTTIESRSADPENRELARQSVFRLDAELVRDQALFVAGLLDQRIGGPSVKPLQPDGYWENLNFPTRHYIADAVPDRHRRGLYVWWQRTFLHPALLAFDAPSREECAADRPRSNIPQQALVLLNDPNFVEAHVALAARVLRESEPTDGARMTWIWRRVLQRAPHASERSLTLRLLESQRAEYKREPSAAAALAAVGADSAARGLDPIEWAAWTHVARTLLNLHETVTRP